MPERAARNLSEDITTALQELRKWRAEGNPDKILYWSRRLDYLTDRLPRVS